MEIYRVTFSCNPNNLSLAAQSTRDVMVEDWADIPAHCASARGYGGPISDVTIISLSLVK